MVLGSVTLWIGSPLFWMWLTSKLQQGTQASMGPYAVMLVGFIATSILIGKALSVLNRAHGGTMEVSLPWQERRAPREVSVLDVVMVVSVVVAALALAIWFFVVEPVPPGLPGGPGGAKH
jgi:hypothetical protein